MTERFHNKDRITEELHTVERRITAEFCKVDRIIAQFRYSDDRYADCASEFEYLGKYNVTLIQIQDKYSKGVEWVILKKKSQAKKLMPVYLSELIIARLILSTI
jgi:hypothetical protein